jgi:glyceraldehyde 3-phosphate dehydrogenase
MSQKNIAINGFGRIGRLATRIILNTFPELNIVAVNDLTSPENLAYLLQHDTTFRRFNHEVKVQDGSLVITKEDGSVHNIKVLSEKDPAKLPWKDLGIETVLECTGFFLTQETAGLHIAAGAKQVILSAPAKDGTPTVVLGVNDEAILPSNPTILSNASCTTNCISPALKVLNDAFGIEQVWSLTSHAYTATQVLQDGPSKKDFRDGRSAPNNQIPSSSGASKAVELVLPELKGKVHVMSLRVPVITGSLVYLTAQLSKTATVEEINQAFAQAAEGKLSGIWEYSTEDLVSSDVIQDSHSSVVDGKLTEVSGNTAKVILWYDNEWGYANRLVELVNKI